jgi:hypothetical protein
MQTGSFSFYIKKQTAVKIAHISLPFLQPTEIDIEFSTLATAQSKTFFARELAQIIDISTAHSTPTIVEVLQFFAVRE